MFQCVFVSCGEVSCFVVPFFLQVVVKKSSSAGPGKTQKVPNLSSRKLHNVSTVRPPIKDTLKEDKPPNKGQAESTLVYTLYRISPLKEDNISAKD